MATARDIKVNSYCDRMNDELSCMKAKLFEFVKEIEEMRGSDREMFKSHIAHYLDIVKTIDWKLEILTRVCPYEWTGPSPEFERSGSVELDESLEKEPVAGYVGG